MRVCVCVLASPNSLSGGHIVTVSHATQYRNLSSHISDGLLKLFTVQFQEFSLHLSKETEDLTSVIPKRKEGLNLCPLGDKKQSHGWRSV